MVYTGHSSQLNRARVRRMARFVSSVPPSTSAPVTTWTVCSLYLGPEFASSIGPDACRHKCQRKFQSAERNGLIARMPSRVPSASPDARKGCDPRLIRKELAWRRTELGEQFLREAREEGLL